MKPESDSPAQPGSAISPIIDLPTARRPSLVFTLIPWQRPALWAPIVDAVYAARARFLFGADAAPTSLPTPSSPTKEPMNVPVAKTPTKAPRPAAEASPSHARLEAAVRKAATAKAKAREAKAALKKAKKGFRLARKAAKTARKDLEALQADVTSAEERAAAAAKRARTTRRAPKTDVTRAAAPATPRPEAPPKPARRTRHASSSNPAGAEVVYTEPLADTPGGSPSTTAS